MGAVAWVIDNEAHEGWTGFWLARSAWTHVCNNDSDKGCSVGLDLTFAPGMPAGAHVDMHVRCFFLKGWSGSIPAPSTT